MVQMHGHLVLGRKMKTTAAAIVLVHLAVGIGLLLIVMNGEELLPLPWLWCLLHFAAAATVLVFLRWPLRGTRALGGAISASAFSARALAFVWIAIVDQDHPVFDYLGARYFSGVAVWLAMATMAELLWWWISGYRSGGS